MSPGLPEIRGVENFKKVTRQGRGAFSDVKTVIDDMIAESDRAAVPWSASATADKDVTMPNGLLIPAGKKVTRRGITILRLRNGKVFEETTYEDRMGLLEQLGVKLS